jgi:hypothetical protein
MFRAGRWYGVKTCVREDVTRTAVCDASESKKSMGMLALEGNELQRTEYSGVNAPADATRLYEGYARTI